MIDKPPKFSIIIPHYDGVISDETLIRGIDCLKNQTFKDFEVLLYHDGPISRPIPELVLDWCTSFRSTNVRYNNWGHSLRDLGIKEAKGEYIVHFNPDNILYPNALDEIDKKLKEEIIHQRTSEIVIFPIIMRGMQSNGKVVWRERGERGKKSLVFTGLPTVKYNIDCMQLVMRRGIWLLNGGWKDKSEESDGNMYPFFVSFYGARYCCDILGEHN